MLKILFNINEKTGKVLTPVQRTIQGPDQEY